MPNKICRQCGETFTIEATDIDFYERISPTFNGQQYPITAPALCYPCRQQRKLSWRNERTLYWNSCCLTGKKIISTYRPESPIRVCNVDDWYADKCDGLAYGRDFDFNRAFFEQFADLMRDTPVPAVFADSISENTVYANLVKRNKNCYFIFAANDNEEALYSTYLQRNRNISDCFFIFDSELCYECIDCYSCYNLFYSQSCKNCSDSSFLLSCSNCSNCFCCLSLAKKSHHIFNRPYSPDDYALTVAKLQSSPRYVEAMYERLHQLSKSSPQKYYSGINNENVVGDHLSFSKNAEFCFDCTHLEDCKYCTWLHKSKNCYDHYAWGLPGELGYENHLVGDGFYNIRFCSECFSSVTDLLYCRQCCNGSQHLFGCVGLQHKEYCVLNKQYDKEEYERLVPRIIRHMQHTGEWSEWFPASRSPYGYNETVAQEYFPLTETQVKERNWNWCEKMPYSSGNATIDWAAPPVGVAAISEDLVREVFECTACRANYRFTSGELKFYRKLGLELPRICFSCRYANRRARRNPRQLWQRYCESCGKQILSSFNPEDPLVVFCEECYVRDVY